MRYGDRWNGKEYGHPGAFRGVGRDLIDITPATRFLLLADNNTTKYQPLSHTLSVYNNLASLDRCWRVSRDSGRSAPREPHAAQARL
jgi:hypothetical protein